MLVVHRTVAAAILLAGLGLASPAWAQTCQPLAVVGGEGSEVVKEISPPAVPFVPFIPFAKTRNNWNTDWAVPGGAQFREFIATITAEEGGKFDIEMYLKYSDQTADLFYDQNNFELGAGEPLEITATARPEEQPYQVNLYIGGIDAVGKDITASVVGCR